MLSEENIGLDWTLYHHYVRIKFPTFALSSVGKSSTWRTAIGGAKKGLIGP